MYTLDQDVARPKYRLVLKGRTYLVPVRLDYVETGNGSSGHVTGVDFMFDPRPVDMDIPSWWVLARQRHHDLTSSLRLIRKMVAADVTVESDVDLTLREPGRPPVKVSLSPDGLLERATVVEEHSPLGDAVVEVLFRDYRPVDGLVLPYSVEIHVNGVTVHAETRSSIAVSESEVDVPAGPVQDGSIRVVLHRVADDLCPVRGAVLLRPADRAAQPVREQIFTSPHTVDPDRLAGHQVPVTVKGVQDKLVLPTAGGGTLELYRIILDLGLDVTTVASGHSGTGGKTWACAALFDYLRIAAGVAE